MGKDIKKRVRGIGYKILPKNLPKLLLTKDFPCARLILAYDEGEDKVNNIGGK